MYKSGVCAVVNRVRHRPVYQLDQTNRDSSGDCRHAFISDASRRTGGIFTWFCKHGICYAFFNIHNAEGRNEAFSFWYKYSAVAPKVVVYDFACALHGYCLNRQPEHFKDTVFLVDRFHWKSHNACARSCKLAMYSQFKGLNSQVAEQCNSALTRIRRSVSQMRQNTCMTSVRLFLYVWNEAKAKDLKKFNDHGEAVTQGRGLL